MDVFPSGQKEVGVKKALSHELGLDAAWEGQQAGRLRETALGGGGEVTTPETQAIKSYLSGS